MPRRNDIDDAEFKWLMGLFDSVSACFRADSPMGHPGMRYHVEEDLWDVTIYPTPVELVGGADDGAVVEAGFSVDLELLRSIFQVIRDFGWNACGLFDPEGPHVFVEGLYQGHEVFMQILAHAPENEEPGLKFDTGGGPPRLA